MKDALRLLSLLLPPVLWLFCAAAVAQDPRPVTPQNPQVSLEDLRARLLPMTREQIKVEAEGWLAVVQQTCVGIADREIAARATADEGERTRLREELGPLRDTRTRQLDRLLAVAAALEAKGGAEEDVAVYRQYATAVGGLAVDVTDASAAWTSIVQWVQSPEGGVRLGLNILKFVATLLAFLVLSRIVGKIVERTLLGFRRTSELLRDFFVNTTRKIVFFIGIVLALSMLEVDIGPFLAAIGAAGFVIAFALQGTLSNFASGIMILLYRPYNIGDYVTVAGVSGTVEAMTLVSTSVRSPDNQTIVVPNGSIWGGIITNVTGKENRRVDLKFGIGYGDDIAKAEAVLRRVVTSHPLVLKDPEPVVKVHELGDSSVNFVVRPWTRSGDYWTVYWDLTRAVKEEFDAAGVSIPFPQRDVHLYERSPRLAGTEARIGDGAGGNGS